MLPSTAPDGKQIPAGFVAAADYLPFGPLLRLRFGNGTTQTFEFDARYRMTKNELTLDAAPPSALPMVKYTYGYDASGNITSILDTLENDYHRHFEYDDLGRLVKANTGRALWGKGAYVWDAMGNMLSYELGKIEPGPPDETLLRRARPRPPDNRSTVPRGRTGSFEYVGTTPLLASVTTNDVPRSVRYDDAGNETSFFATRTYSARNFMEQVTDLAEPEDPFRHTLTYSYDGRGLRSIRAESPSDGPGTVARRYSLYSPELRLLAATRDDSPNAWSLFGFDTFDKGVNTEIVWFADCPVAQVTPGGPILFTFTAHLGTPILQTDSTATITWRVEYEPFGNVYEMRAGTRTDQPLRFPGQALAMTWEGPEENYNVFRWYRAGWGRYSQSDPLGVAGALNLYGYVENNPVSMYDPLGLSPVPHKDQKYRPCNSEEIAKCQASCKYGMENCMVSQTFRVIKATGGKVLYGWVDGPMSCSCKEPDCWDKLKEWADPKKWFEPNPTPPLPPFIPIPPSVPTPKPVIPRLPPFFVNPCMLNPSLCYGDTGIA